MRTANADEGRRRRCLRRGKWFVREAGTDDALRLLGDESTVLLAPDLFRAEVVNALLKQHRKGALTDDLLDKALVELKGVSPQLVSAEPVMERAIGVARRLGHPIYDCLYLALAERWGTILVTADLRFVTACRAKLVDDPVVERLRPLDTLGGP